jgi:hypothetical protein
MDLIFADVAESRSAELQACTLMLDTHFAEIAAIHFSWSFLSIY